MNDGKAPLTFRQTPAGPGAADGYRRRFAILAATSLVLTALGPFGTFQDFAFLPRLAYWGGLIFCGALAFEALIRLSFRIPVLAARHWSAPVAVAVALTAAVQTVAVGAVERATRPALSIGVAELYAYVLLVTLLVSAAPLWRELRARGLFDPPSPTPLPPPPMDDTPRPPGRPPFLDRLPPHLTSDLLALEMEDHYVRVHTDGGSDLLLLRLRDAVAELAGVDGLQVHRSYWVAASAVVRAARESDGRVFLILRNGLRAPVSRSRLAAVRAAGWLAPRPGADAPSVHVSKGGKTF